MGKFGPFVIDADGHGGEPADWQERLPREFQPHMAARRERVKQQFANLPGVGVKETRGTARVDSLSRPGMTDPRSRLEDMDLEGIDVTVMFPGGAGEEWAGLERGFAIALCRTLNDARAEFCGYAPARLTSVAKLPLIDPEAAAAELRRSTSASGTSITRASTWCGARRNASASRSASTAAGRRSTRCRSASIGGARGSRSTPSRTPSGR